MAAGNEASSHLGLARVHKIDRHGDAWSRLGDALLTPITSALRSKIAAETWMREPPTACSHSAAAGSVHFGSGPHLSVWLDGFGIAMPANRALRASARSARSL